MEYVLGIDGGNSKTLALVADTSGHVLGGGRTGCSNYQGRGIDKTMREIREAAQSAMQAAGIEPRDVVFAYYALAGADLSVDFDRLQPALSDLHLAASFELQNDVMAALRSATEERDAVVVILGSGTNGAGRNSGGAEFRLPALGWTTGDWGGGADMARDAVWLAARSWDGRGEPTLLHDMVLRKLDASDMETLILRFHLKQITEDALHSVVPLIFEAAERGDGPAAALVERAGTEAAVTARALLRRLGLQDREAVVVLTGSIARAGHPLLLNRVREVLHTDAPHARLIVPPVEPAVGAVLWALDRAGVHVNDQMRRTVEDTSRHVLDRLSRTPQSQASI